VDSAPTSPSPCPRRRGFSRSARWAGAAGRLRSTSSGSARPRVILARRPRGPPGSIWFVDRTRVVVVGAGVMGSATARSLGDRGVDTGLLEQFRVGHVRGSSHGAGRIFRFSYQEPDYIRLAMRAHDVWRGLEERAGEELLIETGGIDSGPGAEECAAALEACGVPGEWWGAREAEERVPGTSLD